MPDFPTLLVAEDARPAQETARGHHRHRQAWKTIRADVAAKAVTIGVRLVTVPLAAKLLGTERYGLWLTVSSLLMWLNLSQFGLGAGLVNEIGKAGAEDDVALMRRHVATSYGLLLAIGMAVFSVVLAVNQTPLAPLLLGVRKAPELAGEARAVFLLAGAMLAASLVINNVGSVCMGLQEGYLSHLSYAAGSVLSVAAIAAVYFTHGSMLAFAAASVGPTLVANGALTLYVFWRRHPQLRPQVRDLSRGSLAVLASLGGALGLVQLGDLTVLHTSSPLIANRLGLALVPRYAVPFSMFMMVTSVCQGLAYAYQAAVCEAASRREWEWIRSTFAVTRKRGLAVILAFATGVALAGPQAIRWWTGGRIQPDHALLAVMGGYFVFMVLSFQNTVLMVGLGMARLKAGLEIMIAVCHVAGFLLLARYLGLLALPIAGGCGYAIDVLVTLLAARGAIQEGLRAAA